MVRSALVETRRRTQRFSLSTQKRRDCKLGKKRRLVLLFACETLLPTIGPLPVTWHTRAMVIPLKICLIRLICFALRSEEHTSELQSLMRISYAVFCLKKKKQIITYVLNHI